MNHSVCSFPPGLFWLSARVSSIPASQPFTNPSHYLFGYGTLEHKCSSIQKIHIKVEAY